MSKSPPLISVVAPLHNEAANVEPLYRAIRDALDPLHRPYEIVLVNDGSTDDTGERLDQLARLHSQVRVVHLDASYGQAEALSAGFEAAAGETLLTLDGDLQNDPADLPQLIELLEQGGYRVVSGWRRSRAERSVLRTIPSRIANRLIALVSGIPARDIGCSLKAYRREVVHGTRLPHGMHRFIPAVYGVRPSEFAEVPVSHRVRAAGASHYGLSRFFAVVEALPLVPLIQNGAARAQETLHALWLGAAALLLASCILALTRNGDHARPLPLIPLGLIGFAGLTAGYAEHCRRGLANWRRAQREKPYRLRGESLRAPLDPTLGERAAQSRART